MIEKDYLEGLEEFTINQSKMQKEQLEVLERIETYMMNINQQMQLFLAQSEEDAVKVAEPLQEEVLVAPTEPEAPAENEDIVEPSIAESSEDESSEDESSEEVSSEDESSEDEASEDESSEDEASEDESSEDESSEDESSEDESSEDESSEEVSSEDESSEDEDSEEATSKDENTVTNDAAPIKKFLKANNVKIKDTKKVKESKVLDDLAWTMGGNYSIIEKVYKRIKKATPVGRSFNINLKEHTKDQISTIVNFCRQLERIAFLANFHYNKSSKVAHIKTQKSKKTINFLTGDWLEQYVKMEVIKGINRKVNQLKRPITFSYLMNPEVTLSKGYDFEMDMILSIEGKIVWLEVKTGNYQEYVHKYSDIAASLGIEESTFMVLSEIDEPTCESLDEIFDINIVNLDTLIFKFNEFLSFLDEAKVEA